MITFFHRNIRAGFSINKVTQTVVSCIKEKTEYYAPTYKGGVIDILRNLYFIFVHRNKGEFNHITGGIHYGILALIGCKSILTIHDTGMVDYHCASPFKKLLLKWLWFRLPLRYATKVVCISNETKKMVQRYTNRKDIHVIYNAVDPSFRTLPRAFNSICPNILLIGTAPNKNVLNTLDALAGIHCHVTIIGELNDLMKKKLSRNSIKFTNKMNLSDDGIREEYENADIISFISKFEGFGMPIIEANKVGRPVICSAIPVLKEIGQNSALYVDPDNILEMKTGFETLINDETVRQTLVERGFKNVERFSISVIVPQWLNLYKE